ncbi:MAG: DASS family sodium-coupled anion symporter, partial [Bacteroidota bacterium]|nr:DASS family sodium-coupled anion symporter [Bacteroidota bacterium]
MNSPTLRQLAGPAASAAVWGLASSMGAPSEMVAVLSAAAWMLVWWVAEAVPLGVTSVLPLVLFPVLGVTDVASAAAPYGSKYVFLFLGGFLIALALEQWNLHRRFALRILVAAGGNPRRLLGGFMIATAGLSMWISNTATTLMMLPIALSVLSKINLQHHPRFPMALLLGTAYAANLGGIATLMGTPPNVAMAGLVEEHIGVTVPLLEWTLMALPFSVVMLVLVHVLLTRVLCPVGKAELQGGVVNLRQELDALGAWTPAEKRVAWIFGSTAFLWVCRRFIVVNTGMALDDTAVAMAAGVMLFLIPSGQPQSARTLLVWEDTRRLPWDILLLFGGGLTLAGQLSEAGVLVAVADGLSALPSMSPSVLVAGFILASLFLTEIMSNLALTVVMVPVVAQVAVSWGMDPLLLVVPVTMASSCAFMLPMATP